MAGLLIGFLIGLVVGPVIRSWMAWREYADFVRGRAADDVELTVVMPGPAGLGAWRRFRHGRSWTGIVEPLRSLDKPRRGA